jgi:hypothetical protein
MTERLVRFVMPDNNGGCIRTYRLCGVGGMLARLLTPRVEMARVPATV